MLAPTSRRHRWKRASRQDQRVACVLRVTGGIGDGSRSPILWRVSSRRMHARTVSRNQNAEMERKKRDLIRVFREA